MKGKHALSFFDFHSDFQGTSSLQHLGKHTKETGEGGDNGCPLQ